MDKICMEVDPGICGFSCRIEAWEKEKHIAGVGILDSQCELVQKLSACIDEITLHDLFLPITRNPIFISAERSGCHLACPVPVAVVKSTEVALGLAISKDAAIRFNSDCK
ncbi:MAG: hypothetical protein L3J69_16130 [Desulfobacula sp.]|nr:hypothetical protein [Desulfobacula sp.]